MNNKYLKLFEKCGLNFARCLGSKSFYRETYPEDLVVFNARIYTKNYYIKNKKKVENFFKGQEQEIWYGDLNISEDIYKLYKISLEIKQAIIITTEMGSKVVEVGTNRNIIGFIGDKPIILKKDKK